MKAGDGRLVVGWRWEGREDAGGWGGAGEGRGGGEGDILDVL